MKRISPLVMAHFIVPLSAQSDKKQRSQPQPLNSQQTVRQLSSYEVKEHKPSEEGVPDKMPKMNKEDERLYLELINSEEEKKKGPVNEKFLNQMLTEGRLSNKSLLVIKNVSECNMVLQVAGAVQVKIPVPSNGQNAVLLPKDIYKLQGKVCELWYDSQKDLHKNMLVSIKRIED